MTNHPRELADGLICAGISFNEAEKLLCEAALRRAGTIVDAAHLLGITRHSLKRRIIKHDIQWPTRITLKTNEQ